MSFLTLQAAASRCFLLPLLLGLTLSAFQGDLIRKLNDARALGSEKKFEAAIAKFNEVLAADPANLDALTGKMELLGYQKKSSELDAIAQSKTGQGAAELVVQGFAKYAAMSFDEAEKAFQSAVAQSPNIYIAHFLIANIRFTKRDTATAIVHLNKALAIEPQFAEGYFLLGELQYRQKNGKDAIAAWKKYIDLAPKGTKRYAYVVDNLKRLGAN